MIHNLCSVSDWDYLPKILALFNSLEQTQTNPYALYVICLDSKTEEFLKNKNRSNLIPISVNELELGDFHLRHCRYEGTPSQEAISNGNSQKKDPKYIQFCWALAPYTCWYMLEQRKLPDIMYVDSDLFFYEDITPIYEEIGEKSIGIIRHRIDYMANVGEYNVGIVYFRNDQSGRSCARWWKNVLLDPTNPYAKEYGVCGDQKYLELFSPLFGTSNVCVIDENIGHLAPWNVTFHKYPSNENRIVLWEGKVQKVYFFHFAHFVYENEYSYRSSYRNEWVWGIPEKVSSLTKLLYDSYFAATKQALNEIKLFKNQE